MGGYGGEGMAWTGSCRKGTENVPRENVSPVYTFFTFVDDNNQAMDTDLIKKEEFLQLVLNNIPSFVFWKDTASIYLGCNMNFAKSAGLTSPDDIVGKSDYDMPWSREESDFFRKIDREVMDSGKSKINFEEPLTNSDGSTRWLRTSKIPLFGDKGEVIGILGAYEDITDRKSMELELISRNQHLSKLNAKLQMINVDLEQFAYSTSHDLKEPLRMIGSFADLIEKRVGNQIGKEGLEYFAFIKEGTVRMTKLISQILAYSKIDKVEEQFVEVDLSELIQETVQDLHATIKEKDVILTYNLPKEHILCQPDRIKILFHNLIINGIKFNHSPQPKIHIDFEDKGEEWLFSISDNGIGIEEKYNEEVFKPFKRLNTRDQFPGNGIGLSICKRVAYLHGGHIHFKRNQENGTTFYLTISKRPALLAIE